MSAGTVLGGLVCLAVIIAALTDFVTSPDARPSQYGQTVPTVSVDNPNRVSIREGTIACPTSQNLLTVYQKVYPNEGKGADASTIGLLIDHYDCKFLPQGSGVEIVERGPIVTTVALPNLFSRATWFFVRSVDLPEAAKH